MQMVTVMRTGTVFQIPKKLSHHVPRVPILDTSTFFEKTPWKWYNIDMDQFQLYKKAETLIYSISEVAAMNIVSNSDAQVSHTFTIGNMKMHRLLLDGNMLTEEQELNVLKSNLSKEVNSNTSLSYFIIM